MQDAQGSEAPRSERSEPSEAQSGFVGADAQRPERPYEESSGLDGDGRSSRASLQRATREGSDVVGAQGERSNSGLHEEGGSSSDADIRYRRVAGGEEELDGIKRRALRDGVFMKAPNGKATRLSEHQWLEVRTGAFKSWFGDWEKAIRIDKLKASKPIVLSGDENSGLYDLNRSSAKKWALENLRGVYKNEDTGEEIVVSKVGVNKLTSHGERDEAHMLSFVAIPTIIEKSVFIDEMANSKGNDKYDTYRYYACGLQIDGVDYTVKMVVGVLRDSKYYDHRLTRIEKGKLIDNLNGLAKAVVVYEPSRSQEGVISDASRDKDTKLVSLLQMSKVSKVVDENGDPSECICELDATLWSLSWSMSGTVVICRGTHRRG